MACRKDISLKPLTGLLDTRSQPDEMPAKSYRYRQNMMLSDKGRVCRRDGWAKFLDSEEYNNEDLHDQLLELQDQDDSRQPITLLSEAVSTFGNRTLFAGTNSRIYELNESTGNWRLIAEGKGTNDVTCGADRFYEAQAGDFVVFTNGVDKPFYRQLGAPIDDDELFVQEFADFVTIGLSRARVVWSWKGCVFFADLTMDGTDLPHRLIWSDFNKPTSFDPDRDDTLSNYQDLEYGERILAGRELGNSFLIYTTSGIWEMSVIGGEQSFGFRKAYSEPRNKKGCLAYRNTLISLGDKHLYVGADDIYEYSPFYQAPIATDWINLASGLMFDQLDGTCCDVHVAGFNQQRGEIWISYAVTDGNCCPSKTLVLNIKGFADYIDKGFTAFCNYSYSGQQSLREWMIENCICTEAQMISDGYGYVKEGAALEAPECTLEDSPTSIHTDIPVEVTVTHNDGHVVLAETADTEMIEMEDPELESDELSLCALVGQGYIDDLCQRCSTETRFIGASATDWCLKEIGGVYYQETCSNPTGVGESGARGYVSSVGEYTTGGITTILRGAPTFGEAGELVMSYLKVEYLAATQVDPSEIQLRIGQSSQIADPNTDACALVWYSEPNRDLACLNVTAAATHVANNTRPGEQAEWNLFRQSPYLYWEMKIEGTGGESCFSGFSAKIGGIETCKR